MARFIVADNQLAHQLSEDLAGSVFREPETFVRSYNDGLLSTSSEVVKEYVDRIVSAYKDVNHKNRRFTFISEKEILIAEIVDALAPWQDLTRLKREVSELITDSQISENDYFYVANNGDWSIVRGTEYGENTYDKVDSITKLGKPAFEAVFSIAEQSDSSGFVVKAGKLLELDDDFISDAHAIIIP